jgi:hypothetical protein
MKDYKLKQRNLRASHTLGLRQCVEKRKKIGNDSWIRRFPLRSVEGRAEGDATCTVGGPGGGHSDHLLPPNFATLQLAFELSRS